MKTHPNHYHNVSLEAELADACEKIAQQVTLGAEDMASRTLPHLSGDHIAPYYENYHLDFQRQIDKINAELQFTSTCQHVEEQKKVAEQKQHELHNKLQEAKERQMSIEAKLKKTPVPVDTNRYRKALIASSVVCLFEGLFSIPVFESLGMNVLISALLGLLFAGVLAAFAKIFPRILGIGKTIWQRRLIILITFIATCTLFTYLGYIRADYLNAGVKELGLHYSPWPFVCISELLLTVAVAICYFYRIPDEEKRARKVYENLKAEEEATALEIQNSKQSITDLHEALSDLRTINGSRLVYGSMMEEKVIHHAHNAYALFKKRNLMYRTDRGKPDCFDEPYPFTFTTHFHSVTQLLQ